MSAEYDGDGWDGTVRCTWLWLCDGKKGVGDFHDCLVGCG